MSDNIVNYPNVDRKLLLIFDEVLAGERYVVEFGSSKFFSNCYGNGMYVCDYAKEVAYIDFDRDGAVEAIVECGALGDYILRYDQQKDNVTAYLVSPGYYVYLANGEFYESETDSGKTFTMYFSETQAFSNPTGHTVRDTDAEEPIWIPVNVQPKPKG